MIDKNLKKFIETGKVKDYLNYKKHQREKAEIAKELANGVKNATKRGDNS
jgi:hypothetical protein